MRSKRFLFCRQFLAGLTILSLTFTQAGPAWAMRGEAGIENRTAAQIQLGLEETATAAATGLGARNFLLRAGKMLNPAGLIGRIRPALVVEAELTGSFTVTGVTLPNVGSAVFSSPLVFRWKQIEKLLKVASADSAQSLGFPEKIQWDQIQDRRELVRTDFSEMVGRLKLASSTRTHDREEAELTLAAMIAEGCVFCGHRGTAYSRIPLRPAVHGVTTVTPDVLSPVLKLVEGFQLEDLLSQNHVSYLIPEDEIQIAGDGQSGSFVLQEYRGAALHPERIVQMNAEDVGIYARYQESQQAVEAALEVLRQKRNGGNESRLKKARDDRNKTRREVFAQIVGRALGSKTEGERVANTLLEDYLGGEKELKRFFDLFWTLKRMDYLEDIVRNPALQKQLAALADQLAKIAEAEDKSAERLEAQIKTAADLAILEERVGRIKDMVRIVRHELLENIRYALSIRKMENATQEQLQGLSSATIQELWSLVMTLNAIDQRMEARGRDSIGLLCEFTFKDADAYKDFLASLGKHRADFERRQKIVDLKNGAIDVTPAYEGNGRQDRAKPVVVTLVYKEAQPVAPLGANVQKIVSQIQEDPIYQFIVRDLDSTKMIHTRWASAGIPSEPNAHPVGNKGFYKLEINDRTQWVEMVMELQTPAPAYGKKVNVYAVLNGDIFNHGDYRVVGDVYYPALKPAYERAMARKVSQQIGTDTKMITLRVERYLSQGKKMEEAVRLAAKDFYGSFSIEVVSDAEPDKIYTAIGGDGQGLYVGVSPDGFIPASEVYGFIEETQKYLRVSPIKNQKEQLVPVMVVIDRSVSPELKNLRRFRVDTGGEVPFTEDDIETSPLTSRDIDRAGRDTFFIKEVSETPGMVKRTIRGRIGIQADKGNHQETPVISLDDDELPEDLLQEIKEGARDTIIYSGMGTAFAAGKVQARKLKKYINQINAKHQKEGKPLLKIRVEAVYATELGKFEMENDMSRAVIVAITQSGGTTDLNTALQKAVKKGVRIITIVNKRDSDVVFIARQSDKPKRFRGGVLYTGSGRDVEVAVPSTKAYFAQIAAGFICAMKIAQALGIDNETLIADIKELQATPKKQERVLNDYFAKGKDHPIYRAARFWPLRKANRKFVGDGIGGDEAIEMLIKYSELTHTVSGRDTVTGVKHVDMSAHALLIIPAANVRGDDGGYWDDYLMNQIDNFKAHDNRMIIFATEEEAERYGLRSITEEYVLPNGDKRRRNIDVIVVPEAPEDFAPFTTVLGGHLLAYEAARAIGELAKMVGDGADRVRGFREKTEESAAELLNSAEFHRLVRRAFLPLQQQINEGIILPGLDDGIKARFRDVLQILMGVIPVSNIELVFGNGATPEKVFSEFERLSAIIHKELVRWIDAIRDQAKFVSVGVTAQQQARSEAMEQCVQMLKPYIEGQGAQQLELEHVQAFLDAYGQYLRTGEPVVRLFPEPTDPTGNTTNVVVVDKDGPGIRGAISSLLGAAGASIGVEVVPQGGALDHTTFSLFRVDKSIADLNAHALAGGMEEKEAGSFESLAMQELWKLRLGIVSEQGGYLITRSGAAIGAPGTEWAVDLKKIHPSAVLEAGVRLVGRETVVEAGAVIGKGSYVNNTVIRKNARVGALSVLVTDEDKMDSWVLSQNPTPYETKGQRTEIGENASIAEGTYLLNFGVGKGTVWKTSVGYPNIGINGQVGEDCRLTTAKLVLAHIGDRSIVGNFEGSFDNPTILSCIEVTDFFGRFGEIIGQAGRSPAYYVEYVEGFHLPPAVATEQVPGQTALAYRALDFMSNRGVRGRDSIALEFSGTLKPGTGLVRPEDAQGRQITGITPKMKSSHGLLVMGTGWVMGAGAKVIGVTDNWDRSDIQTSEDVLQRQDRTYLGHFAVVAPRGFRYRSVEKEESRRDRVATGEAWGRIGNFSLRGDLTAREEVPAWVLDHAVDVVLTQMAEEFLALQGQGRLNDPAVREQLNNFIQDAIRSEILELEAERGLLEQEYRRSPNRRSLISERQVIVNHGILRLQDHVRSGAWRGEWKVRPEDNQPVFGSWWREGERWVNHTGNYIGETEGQFTIEQLATPVPGQEYPEQKWFPIFDPEKDWPALLALFEISGRGAVSQKARISGTARVHSTAVIEDGAIVEDGAVIGRGAKIRSGARIHAGAQVAYSDIGAGSQIGTRARVYGGIVASRSIVEPGADVHLSMVGSEGENGPTILGQRTYMSLSKAMDGSMLGTPDFTGGEVANNRVLASMLVHGCRIGDANEITYGRLDHVKAGNNNTMNSIMQNVEWGNNIRNDHLSTRLENERVIPVTITRPDGKTASLHLVTTHGAGTTVLGTADKPVQVSGSFFGGYTTVQAGSSLDRSFAKYAVGPETQSPLSYIQGPNREDEQYAGVLSRNGPAFVMRFLFSYAFANTPPNDRWALGYVVEDAVIKLIPQLLNGLQSAAPSDETTAAAIVTTQQLAALISQRDFLEDGRTSADLRSQIDQLQGSARQAVQQALQNEAQVSRLGQKSRKTQLLEGLLTAVEALDGRYRLRYDSQQNALLFTEGVWKYPSGRFTPVWSKTEAAQAGSKSGLEEQVVSVDKAIELIKQFVKENPQAELLRYAGEEDRDPQVILPSFVTVANIGHQVRDVAKGNSVRLELSGAGTLRAKAEVYPPLVTVSPVGLEEKATATSARATSTAVTQTGPAIRTMTALRAAVSGMPAVQLSAKVATTRVMIFTPDGAYKLSVLVVFPKDGLPPIEVLARDAAHRDLILAALEELGLAETVHVHDLAAEFGGNVGEGIAALQMKYWQQAVQPDVLVVTALSGLEEIMKFLGVPEAASGLEELKAIVGRSQSVWS